MTGKYRIIFGNDVLISAAETFSKNFGLKLEVPAGGGKSRAVPGVVLACDVARVDFSELKNSDADLLIGGPPCQDFSIVRGPSWDRRGIQVKRGRLYAHFVRALVALQPKLFVFENVPGLVSANKGVAYKTIIEDFSSLNLRWPEVRRVISSNNNRAEVRGYSLLFSRVVDFSNLGVPQKRERLVIIGVRRDLVGEEFSSEFCRLRDIVEAHLSGAWGLFRKYPVTPIEVFEGKPLNELGDEYESVMREWEGVWRRVGTKRARRWKEEVWDALTFDVIEDYVRVNGIRLSDREELEEAFEQHKQLLKELGYLGRPIQSISPPDGTNELPRESPKVVDRMRMIPPDENHMFVRGTAWEVEGKGISLVYRRIHPLKPAYTVVAYGGGGTHGYHYARERATLTLRERARLQTFPDSFLFSGRKAEIRAQIGEAVPPLAAKRIAEAVFEVFKELRL